MPPDYSKGQIYKLWTLESNEIYIGSTINPLYKRLGQHKKLSNKSTSKLLFERYKDVKIELVENFPCGSKKELTAREGHHQRLNKDILVNNNIAGRTIKEYYIDNADKFKEYYTENAEKIRQYQIENADKIREQKRQYAIANADKIKEYQIANKDKHNELRRIRYANKKLQKNST